MRKKYTPKKRQQLRRVRSFIRRAEKRGYSFDINLKESLSTLSTQKLKSLTPKKLYEQATYSYKETVFTGTEFIKEPVTVSATKGRQMERSKSAKKAAETRKYRAWLNTPEGLEYTRQKEQELYDYIETMREAEIERANQFQQGEIIYDRLTELIDSYETKGAQLLSKMLASEINSFGRENVIRALSEVGEGALAEAQTIVFYKQSSGDIHRAVIALDEMIRGYIRTEIEAKELGDTIDQI